MDGWNAIVSFWGPASFWDFYVKTTNLYSTIPSNPAWLIKRFAIDWTVDPDRPKESTGSMISAGACWIHSNSVNSRKWLLYATNKLRTYNITPVAAYIAYHILPEPEKSTEM